MHVAKTHESQEHFTIQSPLSFRIEMNNKSFIKNPQARFAKVDRMEMLFVKAFAQAFDISESDASTPVSMIMEHLETLNFTEELIAGFPVTSADLDRLGIPKYVESKTQSSAAS